MQDSLSKITEDLNALQASVAELTAALSVTPEVTVADKVLASVTSVLQENGWIAPPTNVEVTQG